MSRPKPKQLPLHAASVLLFLTDILLIVISTLLASLLHADFDAAGLTSLSLLPTVLLCTGAYLVLLVCFRAYRILWRYAGIFEFIRIPLAAVSGGILTAAVKLVLLRQLSGGILTLTCLCAGVLLCLPRVLLRLSALVRSRRDNLQSADKARRTLIVGAGEAGKYCVNILLNGRSSNLRPVVLADDDPHKRGLLLQGLPIAGGIEDIPALADRFDCQVIVVAIPSLSDGETRRVVEICTATRCQTRILRRPQLADPRDEGVLSIRKLDITDFLPQDEVHLDADRIAGYLRGRVVMITGGGGSIGSEICRQVMMYQPRLLLVFDIYENCAYELEVELKQKYGQNAPILIRIGSIREKARVLEIMRTYRPEVVFHAAAHKHVPLMEDSPLEAIKNNILGTRNVLEAASECGVQRFVQLSTDKAVNPTNIMGASKRVTELLVQSFARKSAMHCMTVRFGNVLGSHGSVIPLMKRQIASGGPVTVTHPDIRRFFMTIPEAAQLVVQSGAMDETGITYVLDMGKQVRIMEVAERLIRLEGYQPNVDIPIKLIGLRPGEKLYEELYMDDEHAEIQKTDNSRIFRLVPPEQDFPKLDERIGQMIRLAEQNDSHALDLLHEVVPNYAPPQSLTAQWVSRQQPPADAES